MASSLFMVAPVSDGTKGERVHISIVSTRVRHFSTEGTDVALAQLTEPQQPGNLNPSFCFMTPNLLLLSCNVLKNQKNTVLRLK